MTTPSDRVRERNQEIAATIQPYAEELRESLEDSGLGGHLPERGDVPATEYVQTYRDSPVSLDEEGRHAVKELEAANLQDYLAAVGEAAADGHEIDSAASLYSRHDTIPEDAIDADWYFIDAGYGHDAPSRGIKADCTELPFQDDSLDLILLKAPGGAFIPDSDEVMEEAERVLDDDGLLAASDAYVTDPDGFQEVAAVGPEPAVYHSKLREANTVRNLEGVLRLYGKDT